MEQSNLIFYLQNRKINELLNYVKNNNINHVKYLINNRFLDYLEECALSQIENHDSKENIKIIISLFNGTPSSKLLTKAVEKNYFDIADFLLENNIIWSYDILENLDDNHNLNFYNLEYVLTNKNFIEVYLRNNNENLFNSNEIISRWIKSFKNSFLEIYLKYINLNFNNKIKIENSCYNKAINVKNYEGFMILLDNDERNEKDILGFIINLFENNEKGILLGDAYNNFINYFNNNKKSFSEMNFYFNTKYNNGINKELFINENRYHLLKTKISHYFEIYQSIINNIINCNMDELKDKNYLKENLNALKDLNIKSFNILNYVLENNLPNDIIKNIINELSNKELRNGESKNIILDNLEIMQVINNYQDCNNNRIKNLKYHFKDKLIMNEEYQKNLSHNNDLNKTFSYVKTPIFIALSKNNFIITDLLIEKGIKIREYNNSIDDILCKKGLKTKGYNDMIDALYFENLLTFQNLEYLLNHEIKVEKYFTILDWIKNSCNDLLELYMYYLNNKNSENHQKCIIKDEYYQLAIHCENFKAIFILYDNDKRKNKEEIILYKIFLLFLNNEKDKYTKFMNILNPDDNIDIENKYEYRFIDENRYKIIKNTINDHFIMFNAISNRSIKDIKRKTMELIEKSIVNELEDYIKSNYVINNEISYTKHNNSFDLLIFSIQKDAPIEIIKYIISLYNDLNYSINSSGNDKKKYQYSNENSRGDYYDYNLGKRIASVKKRNNYDFNSYNLNSSEYRFNFQFECNIPLFTAIANNKFEIANLLLKNGANINYKFDIIFYLFHENYLNTENLKYILKEGSYSNKYDDDHNNGDWDNDKIDVITESSLTEEIDYNDKIINKWIKIKQYDLLEIYLKYHTKGNKIINRDYYELALENDDYNALIILFDNDKRDKNEIVYEIIEILFNLDNTSNYSNSSKYNEDIYENSDYSDDNEDFLNKFFKGNINDKLYSTYKQGKKYIKFWNKINNVEGNKMKYEKDNFYYYRNSDEEKRNKIFIDKKRYNNIIFEIKNYFIKVNELLDKIVEIINTLKLNNISKFKEYINNNNINNQMDQLRICNFDILTYVVENEVDINIIEYIINLKLYSTLNYSFKFKVNTKYNKTHLIKTPLFCAIENNRLDIADLLIKHGYNINYTENYRDEKGKIKNLDIFEYLYNKKYFDNEYCCYGLMYLLNNGYVIKNEEILDTIIKHLSYFEGPKIYNLEIILKFKTKEFRKIFIKDEYYKTIFDNFNVNVLYILIDNDTRNIYQCLLMIHKENFPMKDLIKKCSFTFKNNALSYLFNNGKENKIIKESQFLNKSKFLSMIEEIKLFINYTTDIKKKVINALKLNDFDLFKKFINDNHIDLKKINTYKFDILFYALENKLSKEIIKYIINECQYETLNYFNEKEKEINRNNFINLYITPFLMAVINQNYDIADILLSHLKTDINYEPKDLEPLYIYHDGFLNDKSLKYLIKKGYNKVKNLVKYCVYDINCKSKEKYLRIIYNHFYFDNHFIICLLNFNKNRTPLSQKELNQYVENQSNQFMDDNMYDFLVEYGNKKTIDQILKLIFDENKKILILKKFNKTRPTNFLKNYGDEAYYRGGKVIDPTNRKLYNIDSHNSNDNNNDHNNSFHEFRYNNNNNNNNNIFQSVFNNYADDDYSVDDDDDDF